MQGTITVVFDACVLYPALLRNVLIQLATTDLFRARWTDAIHDEWSTSLRDDKPDIAPEAIARLRRLIDEAVPDGLIRGHEPLIESLTLPDPSDRHVLAAAIRGRASVIVTMNTRHFPRSALGIHGLEAQHPDRFVQGLLDRSPAVVLETMRVVRARLKRPTLESAAFLDRIRQQGLVATAASLAAHADRL